MGHVNGYLSYQIRGKEVIYSFRILLSNVATVKLGCSTTDIGSK